MAHPRWITHCGNGAAVSAADGARRFRRPALAAALASGCGDEAPDPAPDGGIGSACTETASCAQGLVCAAGSCQEPGSVGLGGPCWANRDCQQDLHCRIDGVCAPSGPGADGADCITGAEGGGALDTSGFPRPGPGLLGVDLVALYGAGHAFSPPETLGITVRAAGLQVVEPAIEDLGSGLVSRPVSENRRGSTFGACFQYQPSGGDGHFVALAEPQAIADWAAFVGSLIATGTATVP